MTQNHSFLELGHKTNLADYPKILLFDYNMADAYDFDVDTEYE